MFVSGYFTVILNHQDYQINKVSNVSFYQLKDIVPV